MRRRPYTTKVMSRPIQSQLLMPRSLIFFASLWLIGSWMLAIGFRPPVQPSAASYEPGVRLMLLCVSTGLMIAWPLFRLSQVESPHPLRQTMLDLVVLLSMVQIVIWPLRLVTTWSLLRAAAIDITLAGWVLIIGAIIASATGASKGGPRSLAMLACLCLTNVNGVALIELSPFMAVRSLGDGGGSPLTIEQWRGICLLLAAVVAVWAALGAVACWRAFANRREVAENAQ